MLAWAAVLQCTGKEPDASCQLAGVAEHLGGLTNLRQLLQHNSLLEGRDRQVMGRILFHTVSLVSVAYDLRISRLPDESLHLMLDLLQSLIYRDAMLAECVSSGSVLHRSMPMLF